jgi:hypothetical protein
MSSLEQAYAAVEQAYAAADFQTALERAEALLPQITDDRDDHIQQRLQLLIGHIHLHGLQQPAQAAEAPQTEAPDPYDRGLLELKLPGRPSELGAP